MTLPELSEKQNDSTRPRRILRRFDRTGPVLIIGNAMPPRDPDEDDEDDEEEEEEDRDDEPAVVREPDED